MEDIVTKEQTLNKNPSDAGVHMESNLSQPALSQNGAPAQRITTVLLNGPNFHSWEKSVKLYIGSRGKTGWLLGTEKKPELTDKKYVAWEMDNCTILGWLFNSMEPRIYNMFMYHETASELWSALTRTYSHARNDARIYELYKDLAHASQDSLGLSVSDYFGYLQSRWEELAHYEPLTALSSEAAAFVVKRLERQQTYQFLMGLRSEFESLRTQIINTSPMPGLFEAFAQVDGDERRLRLLAPTPTPTPITAPIVDQMAFAANFNSRSSSSWKGKGTRGQDIICEYCDATGHTKARCWKLHPELKQKYARNRATGSSSSPRVATIAEFAPSPVAQSGGSLNLDQLQSQIGQIQDQLGALVRNQQCFATSSFSGHNTSGQTPTAMTASASGPAFEEDFWQGV